MATFQLGPERPAPFAVMSEGFIRQKMDLPYIPEYERYSFGPLYEDKICELIHKHLEINTDDRLCYIGDPKGSLVPILQQKFCLLKPVTTVIPGHIHFEETPSHRMLPIRVASVGAEDFFRREVLKDEPQQFDKILLHDAVNYLDEPGSTLANISKCLAPGGKLMIIHRAAPFNTLPIFNDAKERIKANDSSYEIFIGDLQNCRLEVAWDIECLPIQMQRDKWYGMVQDHFPHQLETVSNYEIVHGLRELSEGVMKYTEPGMVEFNDRLLFVTATHSSSDVKLEPSIHRHGCVFSDSPKPMISNSARYLMEVTPDMRTLLRAKEKKANKFASENNSLFN